MSKNDLQLARERQRNAMVANKDALIGFKRDNATYSQLTDYIQRTSREVVSVAQLKRIFAQWGRTNRRRGGGGRTRHRSFHSLTAVPESSEEDSIAGSSVITDDAHVELSMLSQFGSQPMLSYQHAFSEQNNKFNVAYSSAQEPTMLGADLPEAQHPESFLDTYGSLLAMDEGGELILPYPSSVILHDMVGAGQTTLWRAAINGDLELVKSLIVNGASIDGEPSEDITPLLAAADNGHLAIVELLCAKHADPNIVYSRFGYQAIHKAAQNGHLQVVLTLLNHGAEHDRPGVEGETPLWLAAQSGHLDICQALLNHEPPNGKVQTNVNARCITTGRLPIHQSAQNAHTSVTQLLLSHSALPDVAAKEGETPLFLAAQAGDVQAVHLLLASKVSVHTRTHDSQRTPLHQACQNGHDQVAQLLLQHGAPPGASDAKGSSPLVLAIDACTIETVRLIIEKSRHLYPRAGATAEMLTIAAHAGKIPLVQALLDAGVGIDEIDKEDDLPALARAAENDQAHMVAYLLEHKANVNAEGVKSKRRAIHQACQNQHCRIVHLLYEHDAKLDALTAEGCSPLWLAAQGGNYDICLFLIQNTASLDIRDQKLGRSPLHQAAQGGFADVIKLLLRYGADKDPRDFDGVTPLWLASQKGDQDSVRALLGQGASVSATSIDSRRQALHQAAQIGSEDVVELLLRAGAEVDAMDHRGVTALHLAASAGSEDLVRRLISLGSDVNRQEDKGGLGALHFTAAKGEYGVAKILIAAGADVNLADADGSTALLVATIGDHLQVARLLLKHGARIDVLSLEHMRTTLHVAAQKGNVDIVSSLLNARMPLTWSQSPGMTADLSADIDKLDMHGARIDVNWQDVHGMTALSYAASYGHTGIVSILHQAGADLNLTTKDLNTSALHHAISQQEVQTALHLLQLGADPDIKARDGQTPLWLATDQGCRTVVSELLTLRVDVDAVDNTTGHRALHNASVKGHLKIVQMLLSAKAIVDPKAYDGETPLWLACQNGYVEVCKALLAKDADPLTCVDDLDRTCLQQAAQNGHTRICSLLLGSGVPPDHCSALHDLSPLMLAAQAGHVDVATLLIEQHADVDWRSRTTGMQAIHLAAAFNHTAVAQVLLANSAQLNLRDFEGRTALSIAQGRRNDGIARLLWQAGQARINQISNVPGAAMED